MSPEQLIAEGRSLQRPCVFLRPWGTGRAIASWYGDNDRDEIKSTGERRWLTVDARVIPGLSPSISGFLSLFTDERAGHGGRVEVTPDRPDRGGTALYAHEEDVLPPVDAVFARGSDEVGRWLAANGWDRNERYNDNFPDRAVVEEYERAWVREYPLYRDEQEVYAALGGWHWP